MTAACTSMVQPLGSRRQPAARTPQPRSSNAEKAATKACASELVSVEARIARLDRAHVRIREKLAAAGFERTTAEAMGNGTGAPGLALEAARSADALESLLADQQPVYAQLAGQVDWIAANWFDPALLRWTARHIRTLGSMTAEEFTSLKAETLALRELLPDLGQSKRRRQELQECVRAPGASSPERASVITCSSKATPRVECRESVVLAAADAIAPFRPLDSASMTDDELNMLGPDSDAWIAFVRSAAGAAIGAERVYVDGVPALTRVPASMIGRVTVNGDPFTAEYAGAGETRIDLDLSTPDRRWRVNASAPSLGAGGASPLAGTRKSRSSSLGVSGPVPRLPVTFSMQATHWADNTRPLFAAPHAGMAATAEADLQTASNSSSLLATAAYVTSHLVVRATFSGSRMAADHAGIGGINGPTTGQRLDSRNRGIQTSWRIAGGGRIHRGALSLRRESLDAGADSPAAFTVVTGQIATGGDETAADAQRRSAWVVKHVVEGKGGKWKAGFDGGSQRHAHARTPNPLGRFQFSALDASSATWIVSRGESSAMVRTSSAALFAEQVNVSAPRGSVRSGVRIDWQDSAGVMVSPRVLAALRVSGFQLSGGAGLFVQAWSPDLFAAAAIRDGRTGSTFVVHDVALGAQEIDPTAGDRLRTAIEPGFERRRDLIVRAGVQRGLGVVHAGIEHTWTLGTSLPGTVRERDGAELVDVIGSGRSLRRHQTHLRATARRNANAIVAHYQHAWSFDDSQAALALPARQDDVRGEWARSSGVPRHAVDVTATFRLPGKIRMSLAAEARVGTPYMILTGRDAGRLATFTDRGGLPRNAGTLPPYRKISVSASRLIRAPRIAWVAFDVGMRADNLTNRHNVTSMGHILDSPMFGVPLAAAPGRSIRFWAALAR